MGIKKYFIVVEYPHALNNMYFDSHEDALSYARQYYGLASDYEFLIGGMNGYNYWINGVHGAFRIFPTTSVKLSN